MKTMIALLLVAALAGCTSSGTRFSGGGQDYSQEPTAYYRGSQETTTRQWDQMQMERRVRNLEDRRPLYPD